MFDSKMSTYEHMINAFLYPVGTRGYDTDIGVPVLPEYSILVCLNDKRMRKVVYECTAVHVHVHVLRVLRVQVDVMAGELRRRLKLGELARLDKPRGAPRARAMR